MLYVNYDQSWFVLNVPKSFRETLVLQRIYSGLQKTSTEDCKLTYIRSIPDYKKHLAHYSSKLRYTNSLNIYDSIRENNSTDNEKFPEISICIHLNKNIHSKHQAKAVREICKISLEFL